MTLRPSPIRAAVLLLLGVSAARADEIDPWGLRSSPAPASTPAPLPPAAPSPPSGPWSAPPAAPVPPAAAVAAVAAPAVVTPVAAELRETWDPAGHLVRRLTLSQGRLIEETTFRYDAKGRLVEQRAVVDGHVILETRAYSAQGALAEQLVTRDEALERREVNRYDGAGRRVEQAVEDAAGRRTTTWTYDRFGGVVLVEKRDGRGIVTERTVADRMDPKVPITVSLDGGLSTNSDVDLHDGTVGFSFVREPIPALYGRDPVEVKLSASYTRGRAAGEDTNSELRGRFSLDYNYLWPRLTPFFFAEAERNPVANLDLDAVVAPVGLKVDVLDVLHPARLDLSFAPVWNYRAITTPAGGDCDGLTVGIDTACQSALIRGSLRLKAGYEAKRWSLMNTLELLPVLFPDGVSLADSLDQDSITRDTIDLEIKLTGRFTVTEKVVWTRDMSLADQVDCSTGDDNRLCEGRSVQSTGLLSLRYTFQ